MGLHRPQANEAHTPCASTNLITLFVQTEVLVGGEAGEMEVWQLMCAPAFHFQPRPSCPSLVSRPMGVPT